MPALFLPGHPKYERISAAMRITNPNLFPLQMYYKYHTVAKTALKSGYVPQWGIGTPYLCSVRHTGPGNGIGKGL